MCGIVAAFLTKPRAYANELVVDQYEEQFDRGQKGFGVIGIDTNKKFIVKRATEPTKFMFDLHHKKFPFLIAHHRMPTSSGNYLDQTHPIRVSHDSLDHDYLVVHNGVIGNADELKKKHEALGFKYVTEHTIVKSKTWTEDKFNDSESLAIELARFIEKDEAVVGTRGAAAFIVVQIVKASQKVKRVYFGRNDTNPLNFYKSRGLMFMSSEGNGDPVTPHFLYSCILEGEMELTKRAIAWAPTVAHTYQSKSSATTGTTGTQSPGTSSTIPSIPVAPNNGSSHVPTESKIEGFVANRSTSPGVVTTPSGVKYESSPGSGILVPSTNQGPNTQLLSQLAGGSIPGPKLTNEHDDAEYEAWWRAKQAAEVGRGQTLEESAESEGFLGTQREDIDAALEEFFEYLADGDTCPYITIDDTLKEIRTKLESAKAEAMRIHALVRDGSAAAVQAELDYAGLGWDK